MLAHLFLRCQSHVNIIIKTYRCYKLLDFEQTAQEWVV